MSDDAASRSNWRRTLRLGLGSAIALCFALVGAGAIAQSSPEPSAPASTSGSEASVSEPIPMNSLGDLSSLDAVVTITADGTMEGKQMSGDITATLTSNDQSQSQIDVTGSLLGPVAAQVGGKLVGLFRPKQASVYTVSDGTYVVVSGLTDVCVKPADNAATDALSQLSPQVLMETLTSSDVAQGQFVGDETIDGTPVKHYVIDGAQFLDAAQSASTDPTVQSFAQSLTGAADADLYVSTESGYPVSYSGSFSGAYEPLGLDGDFTVQIDLTGVNSNAPVALPGACDHPIPY